MNEPEAVNSSVKPSALTLRRYDFTSLGQVIEVPGGSWVKFDDVWEMLNYHAKRPEDSLSDETRDKMPAGGPRPILDDSAKDYDDFFEAVAEASGASPMYRKSRQSLLAYLKAVNKGSSNIFAMYQTAQKDYRQAQLELAKANKGIRRLRKRLDAAKKRIAEGETAFNDLANSHEHSKRVEEGSGNAAEKGPSHSQDKPIPERAIPIWDGNWILTSDGDILPRG